MIKSADEFKRLRQSTAPCEYRRAAHEEAPIEVWWDVLRRFPELAFWVAQNKRVQIEVLAALSVHPDSNVRDMVARKRKLPESLMLAMAQDQSASVRHALVNNGKVTESVLRILQQDSWEVVSELASEKLVALRTRSRQTVGSKLEPSG